MHRSPRTFLTLAVLVLAACAERQPQPLEPAERSDVGPVAARATPDIIAVQNRYTPDLMMRDGVIGTGIRLAAAGERIVVYAVTPSHAAAARIPERLEGYDVEVVVTGRIDAVRATNPTLKARPAPSGFSVGHPDITAGTIGAKVKDASGNVYILSNNHVLANSNAASIGDATLQPGPYDGGTSADQIGTLAAFETIVMGGASNTMDAAIASVSGADLLGRTPDDAYGAPGTTPVDPALNMAVQKFGRTTGHTTGTVTEVNVTVSVCYVPRGFFGCAEAATFTGQIGISPGDFSAGGDSGSLIVTNNASKSPVGLLFAGSSTRTLANPIKPVLQRFGISIDTSEGSGGEPPPPGEDTTAPSASFTYSCSQASCNFSDTSTDNVGVTTRQWSGAFSSTAQNPSHTFGSAGDHTVTLTVGDAAGNSSSTSRTVSCSVRGKRLRCS